MHCHIALKAHLSFIFLFGDGLRKDVHYPPTTHKKKKVQNDFHYSKYFQLKEKTKENQIVIYKGFIELSLPNQPVNKHTGGFTCCTELKEWEESVFTWV